MKKTIVAILIASIAWAIPLHAVSAERQQNEVELIFINYEQHRQTPTPTPPQPKQIKSVPKPQGTYNGRHYAKEEVKQLIYDYSQHYGIKPEVPLCIALKESGYNQFSKNRSSTASGVFQYIAGTWAATDEGKAGLSVFDAEANIKAAIKYMAVHKNTRPWVVGTSCPKL